MLSHFGLFMLRRPLIAVDQLEKFHRKFLEDKNPHVLREWYIKNPGAQEAIYLASGVLYERFMKWLEAEKVSETDKLEITLYKYLVRMSTRCTPYGFFALASTGIIGDETDIQISTQDVLIKHTRLDMECLIAIKEWLIRQQSVRMQLTLSVNSSLYSAGEDFRYIEQVVDKDRRNYFISSLESNEYLCLILDRARNGVKIPELIALLQIHTIEAAEAYDFIDELIENRILVSELEPNVTGVGYLDTMIEKISLLDHTYLLTGHLSSLLQLLSQQVNRVQMYQNLQEKLNFLGIPAIKKDLVHVDTVALSAVNQLSEKTIFSITQQLSRLFVLNRPKSNADLEEFKRRFQYRYQQQEVALTTALDHQTGIGYGLQSTLGASYTPMIEELSFPKSQKKQTTQQPEWWQNLLLDKYTLCLKDQLSEIELTDRDLNNLEDFKKDNQVKSSSLPYSFYILGNLLAQSGLAVDQGEFLFNLLTCSGPSAVNILSRFHEADPSLSKQLLRCAELEENNSPDVIFAEIVHCPDSGAGNIMTRPVLHRYEIPYMGKASVDEQFQVPVQDLMISVVNDKIILRSKRLNKRIIPRLSNAHNFTKGLPIYKFLCELQLQDSELNMQWDWGLFSNQPHLPRVKYKNMILSRESWLLQIHHFKSSEPEHIADKLAGMGLPSKFVITSGDNELLIDTRISLSLQILIQEINKNKEIRVFEALFSSDNSLLRQDEFRFTNEIVIPLYNPEAAPLQGISGKNSKEIPQRSFSVGSEWLYFKIYCEEKSSDKLLLVLHPLINRLIKENMVSQFFFVRYQDPDYHLRFRFRGNPQDGFYYQVIDMIKETLEEYVQSGLVYKIQLDTYERELERYGYEQIEICENLFHLDSMDFLDSISSFEHIPDEIARFELSIGRINMLLTNSGLKLSECVLLMENLKENFFNEFDGNSTLRKQLGMHYRNFKNIIDQVFELGKTDLNPSLKGSLAKLSENLSDRTQYFSILSSLIHMSVNRTFNTKQRAYELILYHCLAKQYDSMNARQLKMKG
ncbi:lantibiotic dehydratase [Dyadobacter frigoris]|uniref:Lantibiotic dehydratase n=1 Tax=Dyadobacter frigoris TaxID=2576211 RepID=A0A4U6CY95_9BACT|nr:lantibiotic dehydratase [Dyadobacter frigoris]TKT89306.1 lantibiotic dehydratase [Dyadobacter frigoris]GLU57085.1 lantibiotic dehydratase [Dyadobacter frigoris]